MTRNSGKVREVSTFDLLVGDIIHIKQGDHVPADCLLIEGDEVRTDESNITGESDHLKKSPYTEGEESPSDAFLLADSMIVNGKGLALVCCVG